LFLKRFIIIIRTQQTTNITTIKVITTTFLGGIGGKRVGSEADQ